MAALSRLHADLASIEQRRRSSQALLDALLARPRGAPLGVPVEPELPAFEVHLDELERRLQAARPEIRAAQHAVKRSEAAVDGARARSRWPTVMAGLDYWNVPNGEFHNAYGAMVTMSLPWLNPAHREEVRAAQATLAAERSALESVENASLFQLRDAAALTTFRIIEREVVPRARQTFEAAQSAFAAGQASALGTLDVLRGLVLARIDRSLALARLGSRLGDLDRAVGAIVSQALGAGAEAGEER